MHPSSPLEHQGDAKRDALVAELEQRIDEFDAASDEDFGKFSSLDWILCTAGALLIPCFLVWWFRG